MEKKISAHGQSVSIVWESGGSRSAEGDGAVWNGGAALIVLRGCTDLAK